MPPRARTTARGGAGRIAQSRPATARVSVISPMNSDYLPRPLVSVACSLCWCWPLYRRSSRRDRVGMIPWLLRVTAFPVQERSPDVGPSPLAGTVPTPPTVCRSLLTTALLPREGERGKIARPETRLHPMTGKSGSNDAASSEQREALARSERPDGDLNTGRRSLPSVALRLLCSNPRVRFTDADSSRCSVSLRR